MKKNSLVCLFCLLSVSAITARADETQDPIIVTATRIATPQGTALGSTTVITDKDIERAQSPTLVDALQDLGGVQFARNGGPGTVSSIFLRGTNSNQTLILLDGVPIQTATLGTAPLEHISPAEIERIEIVRGNASSLYGANAMGGVVQIFTKSGTKPTATIGAGSYRTRSGDVGVGNSGGLLDLSMHASYFDSDSFAPVKPEHSPTVNPNSHGYRNSSASIKASHTFDTDQELGAGYYTARGDTQFNDYTSATDLSHNEESLGVANVYSRNRITDHWRSLLRYAHTSDNYNSFTNDVSTFKLANEQTQWSWQNDVHVRELDTLLLGIEQLEQHAAGDSVFSPDTRRVSSAFTGYTANLGPHRVEASARRDDYTDFGPHNTGSIAYGYRFTPQWESHVTASTAFRAPTFYDLHYVSSYFVPNPDLKPERSRNAEAGVRFRGASSNAALTYFDTRIRDLIVYSGNTVVNLNEAEITGAEFSYDTHWSDYVFRSDITMQNPRDKATQHMLARRSQNYGTAEIGKQQGRWYNALQGYATSKRYDDAANTVPLGGYTLLNLVGSYALNKELTLRWRVENLLDRRYELIKGYNTPGRGGYVFLEYRAQ